MLPWSVRERIAQLPFQPMSQGGSSLTTSFPCFHIQPGYPACTGSLWIYLSLFVSSTLSVPLLAQKIRVQRPVALLNTSSTNMRGTRGSGLEIVAISLQHSKSSATVGEKREPRSARMRRGPGMRRPPPTQPARLMAQAELGDQRAIALGAFLAQIFQEPAALTNHHQQAPARVQVMFMHLEMLG